MKRTTHPLLGEGSRPCRLSFISSPRARIGCKRRGTSMASQQQVHRAVAAGISGGACLALPLVAYAASLPFGDASQAVAAGAVPLAAGGIAGVGLCTLSRFLVDRAEAARVDEGDQPDKPAVDACAAAPDVLGARRRKRPVPADVPIIARAQDALPEDEAWAQIDSIFDDSPVSCDAESSKDIYQIALEELAQRTSAHARSAERGASSSDAAGSAPAAETAGRATASTAADLASGRPTALVVAGALSSTSGDRPAAQDASADVTSSIPAAEPAAATTARLSEDHAFDTDAARLAALASLGDVSAAATSELPAMAADADVTSNMASRLGGAAPAAEAAASASAASASGSPAVSTAVAPGAATSAPAEPVDTAPVVAPAPTIPMADYSGHEDMWASALGILDEDAGASPEGFVNAEGAGSAAAATPAASAPSDFLPEVKLPAVPARPAVAGSGRHFAAEPMPVPAPRAPRAPQVALSASRAEAMAEGDRATEIHNRVNEILGEEVARVRSKSMHRTAREFLRVIEGGTMSMPRLRAEA